MRFLTKNTLILVLQLLLLSSLSVGVLSISNKVLYPVSSNMGLKTDYYLSFTPDLTYSLSDLNIKLQIPIQYDLSQITNEMECYMSPTGKVNTYQKMSSDICFTQPYTNTSYSIVGDIIIKVNALSSATPLHFVFRNIVNPLSDSSSYFGLEIRSGTHLLESDRQFRMLTFTPDFAFSTNAISITTNPLVAVAGQGTTYFFKFRTDIAALTSNYDIDLQNMEIRMVLPPQYSSTNAICSLMQLNTITGTYAAIQVETASTPSKSFSIECKKIRNIKSSFIYANPNDELYLKIENVQNPVFSDTFSNFYIQISRGGRNQIIQQIQFSSLIQIQPQQFDGEVKQTHMMRNATTEYFFYFTHDLDYSNNSKIKVTIGNNSFWKINEVKLMFGFTNPINFTSVIKNSLTQSYAEITNFGLASKQLQQVISLNLTSSDVIGDQKVKIQSFIDDKLSGVWNGIVQLNSTWGSFNRLSFSAVQQPVKLPVGKTGPLEFTLFLNYELPESQNIENGSMIFSFTPPIPTPDPDIYGKVKCYFKATMQAADCIYDNSDPTKTKVTIISPPFTEFQYSQIPIIITTQGGIDSEHEGLTISPVVQRYKFDVQFFLYNSSTIPSEVLYTNWLADAIQLPGSLTGNSLSWQCNQVTALHFNLITPLMITPQQRMMFHFMPDSFGRSAWHPTLGYAADKIYKEFPCVVVGLPGQRIKCDLYTYVNTVGPYNKLHINSKSLAPFIMLYGFETPVPTGSNIQVYLPGIKLSNNLSAGAVVSFSILQQTPGDTEPYIELYHQNINIFNTIAAPSIVSSPSFTNVPQIQVQTSNLYTMSWNPVNNANVAFIRYEFTQELPSIDTLWGTCSGTCYSSGYPNNWMVEIPAAGASGSVTSPHTLTGTNPILSMPYINSLLYPLPVKVTTYSATGQTLQRINIIHEYIPQTMTGTFNLLDPTSTIYSGLKQWYQVGFSSSLGTTSQYPFIKLKLSPQLQFADPQQCESLTILAYNETGIECILVPGTNNHELLVYNIKSIDPSTGYDIKVRLRTTADDHTVNINPTVDVYVHHNQTIVNAFDQSFVEDVIGVPLVQIQTPIKAAPQQFTIHNPQVLNEEIRVNYIGRLFIDFQSSVDMTTNLKITFPNHRYNTGFWNTQNGPTYDPMVCMNNGVRFYCQQTYGPLTVVINSVIIKAGSNRLQLDTEYVAPYNGLVFPAFAGNYQILMSTINSVTNVETTQHSFYVYIHPPSLEDIEIESIVKDINTQSVYLVNFTIADALAIPLANHAVGLYSRIFIQFPTMINGQRVFLDNLGGYQGVLNQRVGCSFLTGTQYVIPQATKWLECRLIPPEIPGAPVKVQVINFDAFSATLDSMGLFIFKVWNPDTALNSFEIKVKINNYAPTGQVFPIFESDYVVFLDPRSENTSPTNKPSSEGQMTNFFNTALDVGDAGTIQLKAQTINAATILPFYMLVKLPKYLPIANEQLTPAFASCPPSNFEYCVSSPDVNYALVKTIVNQSFFTINIKDYPLGISQVDSYFYSIVVEEGRWAGNIQHIISQEKRWLDIRGDITFGFIQPVGLIEKAVILKQRFHVAIQFTTTNYIPQTGTIEISFPTSVTKIYPYCRSAFANGSALISKSGSSGQIGCDVQNTNKWVITGFTEVPPLSSIMISGYIDLPSTSGTLGSAEIITYTDNHPTDIYTNGSQIDYCLANFNLYVQNVLAMNPNQNVFLTQRDVVRANDVADFRILFKLSIALTTTGYIKMDFSKKDINGMAGGFSFTPSEKKVCEFIDIATETRVGCQVTAEQDLSSAGQTYVRFTMRTFEDLLTTKTYELRLTTQKYSYPTAPEGIRYPSVPSTYKIQTNIKYSSSSAQETNQHLYMDVYGPEFTNVKVTQYNYIQNKYNPYWFEIQPSVTITIKHQIIIEFPTKSNDGVTNLFSDNLGLTEYKSGNQIAMDIFETTVGGIIRGNDFMKCHIHHGSQASGIPVKVVCGGFLAAITSADTLRFAIGIINPIITAAQVSIPLLIYSHDPYLFTRTQFNLVNGAGYVFDKSNFLSKLGYPASTSMQQQTPNDDFLIGAAHTFDLLVGDAFVVKFGFPIRVNGKVPGGCVDAATKLIVYGDAYYHQRMRTVVCKMTALLAADSTPAAVTLAIKGFYTPWYFLSSNQQKIYAIAHYYSITSSEFVTYTDTPGPFPNFPARWQFAPPALFTMAPVLGHNTICQRDDYIFTVQLQTSLTAYKNLQYTKLVGIVLPLQATVDFLIFGRDCIEHPLSEIQVRLCEINEIARTIYIEIVPGIYPNNKKIIVQTKGLAIRNPCITPSSDINQFTVNFFSWENITASDKRANNRVYMTLDSRNIPSTPLVFGNQLSNAANNFFYPFDWVDIPNEKYFNEFHQFKAGQYSPFKFDLYLTTAISAQALASYNTLTLYYGPDFDIPSPQDQYIQDMKYNTELCYLRNTRVARCQNDFANKKITMFFEFDLPLGEWINVYFSIQNPTDLELNGFRYKGSYSDVATDVTLQLTQFGSASTYHFKANPFEAKQTNFNPALTTMPERTIINGVVDYANSLISQLNVIDMTFTLNTSVTNIKGLKFQIPLVDQFGVQIFSNPNQAFMELADGDEYPCGNNDPANPSSGKAKCYLFHGDNLNMGQPATIIMTDFVYTTQIKARLIMKNPAAIDKWVTINVKAFRGTTGGGQTSIIGHQYVGYWRFPNIFKTVASAGALTLSSATASTSTLYPSDQALAISTSAAYATSNPLWMDTTTWVVTGTSPSAVANGASQYIIFESYLNNYDLAFTEKQFCHAKFTNGNIQSDDMIVYKSRKTGSKFQKVFFIRKYNGSPWWLQYFKCKHYRPQNLFKVYYHATKLVQQVATYTVSVPFTTFDYTPFGASTIKYYDMMNNRVQVEIDIHTAMTAALARGLKWENQVNYVMKITTDNVIPFTGISACYATGGFQNNDGKTVGCRYTAINVLIIEYFSEILTDQNGRYTVRFDVVTSGSSMGTLLTTISDVYIYAGPQAFAVTQDFFHVTSSAYSRQIDYWPTTSIGGVGSTHPPVWTAITSYSNFYQTPKLTVQLQQAHFTGTVLNLRIKVQVMAGYSFPVARAWGYDHAFRFYLEGINAQCGTITRFDAQSNVMALPTSLLSGVTCAGKNYFHYQSYIAAQSFPGTLGLGTNFDAGEWIIFTVQMTVGANDPSWTRDWISAKVFFQTTYLTQYCCTGYDRYYEHTAYGQVYHLREELFTGGVDLNALSNLANTETQLQVIMRNSQAPINPTTTNKLLLFEFNTGSTTLFPYINATANVYNYLIECNCLVSQQPDFSGATIYATLFNNLQCYLKFPQGNNIYTSISVDLNVPVNNYAKCYFPGFMTGATSLQVTAKLTNKGVNQANYPTSTSSYGSPYRTTSSVFTFYAGSIPNSLTLDETPKIYDGTTPVKITTSYSTLGTYTLTVDMMSPNILTTPTFYVNFQKGGPVPDQSLCSISTIYDFCRIYSKYRNIMVAKYKTNTQIATFSSSVVTVPLAKQPNLGSDYNMIVYVKGQSDSQYTFGNTFIRSNPPNLVPSSTIFTVSPDRLTSNNYETFTSNLVLSFKLQNHPLESFWTGESKIQISYDQAGYISADKGCIVSTDDIADDNQFSFFCEIDSANKVIKIHNRYFNNPFSVGGLIQVIIGVVNQANTLPVKFTLRMYKWWRSAIDHGLLIQSDYTYTPLSLAAGKQLQSRNQMRQYPFYTRFYSDAYAPFRMAFKFPPTMTLPISYLNDATTFMILDDFDGITPFAAVPQVFECYLKQFTANPPNTQPPQTNGFRNYKQNTQYYFVPTYCTYINTTALRIQIPRNRDLDNTKYYQLVVMPISTTRTGFDNVADSLAKLVTFPANTAQHIFDIKLWTKNAFTLTSLYIVNTRPLQPNALQLTFSTNFASNFDFPNHYIEIVFNNLDLTAISSPYNQMGETVPCSFSTTFLTSALGIQKPNCIVTYADKFHQVLKIRVQNFKTTGPASFKLSFDYFFLPSIANLLQQSNTFTVCMNYWSAAASQERCFGQLFIIDGYINTTARTDLTSAAFLPLSQLRYGAASSPTIQLSYPKTTTSKRDEKIMIKITGGYSAVNSAPLGFSGSTLLWYNPMINLYIQSLNTVNVGTNYQIALSTSSGLRNPYPYEMEEYMLGNDVQLTFFAQYHPNTKYTLSQPLYPSFIKNNALVKFGALTADDIKISTNTGTQAIVMISISTTTQTYANLALHENNRFEVEFVTNVVKVKRCWVNTVAAGVQYSKISVCTPKPGDPLRLQLLNFFAGNTNNNLVIYAMLEISGNSIQAKSHLFALNDQEEFQDSRTITIASVTAMPVYTDLSWTQSHYTPGYYEQIITPISHTSQVQFMYFSMFIPQNLVEVNSVFTILLNSTLSIQPMNFATSTRLVCQWMKVNKYGRTYQTGKFSHCLYSSPNIVINAPLLNLPEFDASGNRIPYLLKVREQSPTGTLFKYPTNSQVQEIILQSATGGIFKKDTLRVRPYQHFNGMSMKHTTLTINQLNTYTVQFAAPLVAVGAGTQYVLTLELESKYLPDTLGIKDIYNLYGDDSTNSTIVNNLQLNMVYNSLPNKWFNGIPYSCWTSLNSAAEQTCIEKSDKTIRINLLLAAYTAGIVWKVPLLKNPSTQKPFRMNLTLWSYPAATTQGHKELFYEIINEHVTKISPVPAAVAYDISVTAQANNRIQTSTNSMNVQFATYVPTADDVIQMKILARAVGMINIPSFLNPAFIDTTYDFFFFKNINFLIGQRKNLPPSSKLINIGAIEVSNQFADEYGYGWLKIHSAGNKQTVKVGGQVKRMMPSCTIPTITYTLMSGKDNVRSSNFQVKFTFTTPCNIPANSTVKMIVSTSDLQFLNFNDQTYCETSFRSRDCWVDASKNLFVRIDQALALTTVMTVTTFARSKSRATIRPIQGEIYAIPEKPTTVVNSLSPLNLLPVTSNPSLTSGSVFPLLIKPLYQNTYSKMTGTFTPGHLPFTFVQLISPFSKLITSNQTFYYQSNTTGSPYAITEDNFNLRWIRTKSTMTTVFDSTETILPNGLNSYGITPFTQYRFSMGSMYETTDLNNFLIGPVGAYYQFEYHTDKQIAYHEVYPVPVAQVVTVINPLTQVSQETVIGIQFISALQDILPGDKIQIQLDSHNLIEDMYRFTDDQPECIEYGTPTLTSNPTLVCQVAQYPDSSINRPLLINVYPTNLVPLGTPVNIWISPVINSPNVLVAGVTVKVLRFCSGEQLCKMYQGRGWYKTTNSIIVTNYGTSGATFSAAPTTVLQTGAVHSYTFNSINLLTTFIKYPQNYEKVMSLTCTTANTCIVFPKQRRVVTVQAGAATTALTINGMTNGIYVVPQQLIELKLASATKLDKYTIIHPPLTERQVMPLLGNAANTFTITNTQNSGAIFLRNYWNTVKMEIQGLYTSEFIKAFYIVAPVQVTEWDNTYCNATIESPSHLPYPTRLQCLQITANTIQIKIPEGVQYQPGVSETQTLTVHAKFWIEDFPPGMDILYVSPSILSQDFNAYGSFSDTSFSSNYYITQAYTPIWISQHKTPLISQVAFNTESFEQRLASINQPTTFDILIDPLTTDPVDYIELIIPEEFKYPDVLNHDMCQLIYRRTTDLPTCRQTRRDNQTIIAIDVDQSTYDNGPRILRIASKDMSDWFTAPNTPGSLYNMTISLYGTDGSLLEKQSTKNSSRIKGLDLKLSDIVVQNGHDQLQEQIYDITFKLNSTPVKQGYRGILANGDYYSEIRVKFETVQGYEYLLGGYYKHLDRVGCVTSLKSINKEITCIFDMGTNINDEPTIIVSNYEQIAAFSTIKLSFANIKNLPLTLRNTIGIQVKYYKVGDQTPDQKYSFMMYDHEQAITDATTALSFTLPTALAISYPAQTIVNEPTTFQVTLTPSVAVTSYIVVKFPKNGLRDQYQRFNVQCTNCGKFEIFYRAQVLRIYPSGGTHAAGSSITYTFTGFPSTQYIVDDPAYPITLQAYSGLKIVHKQVMSINLKMQGCKLNSGIIASTSPYGGDTGVSYTFEAQLNVSQLTRSDEPKQLNMMIKLPNASAWFTPSSSCQVQLPLVCSIDTVQKRIVIKNLIKYTKSTVLVKTFDILNPSAVFNNTNLTFTSSLFEETSTNAAVQQNTICLGSFDFTYLPSPPNKCIMTLTSQHESTIRENVLSFGIVCQQAIRNRTVVYMKIPSQMRFNNLINNTYKCWTDTPSILLDIRCQIVFINGTFFIKTMGELNIFSNVLEIKLNVVVNNPLGAGNYWFGSTLQHSGNFYSVTNNASLQFYSTPVQPQLNSSISLSVLPKQAGAQAIYVVKVPTQILSDKLQLNFGSFGVQIDQNTKISYYQPEVDSTLTSMNNTDWLDQQTYFSLLQNTYANSLTYSTKTLYDFSQDIKVDTSQINSTQSGWTYIMLSPVVNPSSSSASDNLSLKIFDTVQANSSSYNTLLSSQTIPINLNIENPPTNIYQTQYSVVDNDILSSTIHNISFTLDHKLFANQNGVQNVEFVLDPPITSLTFIKQIEACLYYPNPTILIQCQPCKIGYQQLSFKPSMTNLTFDPQIPFTLVLNNLTNPENQTFCSPQSATLKDYLASWFKLKIFVDQKLAYQSVYVGMIDDSNKPCVEFKSRKGDILNNLLSTIPAGFQTAFNISITQPTANLRVFLKTNDTDLTFSTDLIYFNSYDIMSIQLKAIASPNSANKSVEVKISREQTNALNSFREPQPFVVKIIAGNKETVTVNEMQSSSVGYDIRVPVILSKPSLNNMSLLLTVQNSPAFDPYMQYFTITPLQVPIPAQTVSTYFTVRYNGTKVPPTLNISLKLISQNTLTHYLVKETVYLYFSIDPKYQTLPPVMRMNVLWSYKSNNDIVSKTVYYCCDESDNIMTYDYLKPVIIDHKVDLVTATKAQISIWTRNQATLYYQFLQRGKHFELSNKTSTELRQHTSSLSSQTFRNSSKIVNAYQTLNFTNLQHQTQYYLYVSAFDAFGDSENVTVIKVKTGPLSSAIKFNLNCFNIQTDEVMIVRALADILKIDMRRIKVTSSQKNLQNTFTLNADNKPIYSHEIVISPSLTDDSISPEELFKSQLLNNPKNQGFLKEKIPSWNGNFDPISRYQAKKPYYEIAKYRSEFKQAPYAQRISYYNVTLGVKFWTKARVSAVILVQERKTPDNSIEFINKKPRGKKISELSSTQQELSPNSKQIYKGLNQFNQKLAPKYTFTGLTNEDGEGIVFFKGLKPGSYCKVYITSTNPETYEPTASLLDAQVYVIEFNMMWNPNLKGDDHLVLNQLSKKNPKMYEVIKQYYDNQNNDNKKNAKSALKKA